MSTSRYASRRRVPKAESLAAIKRRRTARLTSLATKSYYMHRRGQDEQMYNLICEEFVSLGGIYIKFLQGVLLQSSVMRRWHNPDKLKIFENLEHEQIDIIQTLHSSLPPDRVSQIAFVQPEPFAAGSFGQVYYGQHADGTPIVIKVLRPLVAELLRYDLRILAMFSRSLVVKSTPNVDVDMDKAIKDFRRATLRETDYKAEVAFACEMHEAYKNHPMFIVPRTYAELCTDKIIVQEYVDGLSVAQLIRLQEQGVDPREYVAETLGSDLDTQLTTLGVEQLYGVFNLSRIQGDPHPGNVRLMPGNKVALMDFGISASSPANKSAFLGLITAWDQVFSGNYDLVVLFDKFLRFFVNDLYRALKRLGDFMHRANPDDDTDYTASICRIAESMFRKSVGVDDIRPILEDGSILGILNQVVNKNNRFGFVVKIDDSEVLRASQTYITLVETLGRRQDILPDVFREVISRVEREHPDLIHQDEETLSVSQALGIVNRWLERVALRDPALFQQLIKRVRVGNIKPADPLMRPKSPEREEELISV